MNMTFGLGWVRRYWRRRCVLSNFWVLVLSYWKDMVDTVGRIVGYMD